MNDTRVLNSVLAGQPMVRIPARWWVAKAISLVFSPPLLGLLGLALLGLELNSTATWLWTVFSAVANILAPVIYILFLMRNGELSDFHLRERTERVKPMTAFLLLFSLSWLVFQASGAPYLFQVLAIIGTLQAAVMLLVTLRWKISGHGAGAAGFSALLWGLNGSAAAPAFLIIPLVIWARVSLNRHDLAQSLAGAALGLGCMAWAFELIALRCPGAGLVCI